MAEALGTSALITGVGGGFGRAIALAIGRAGAGVTLTARSAGEIDRIAGIINGEGGRAQALTGDVRDTADAGRIYAAHKARYGVPDILINSASLTQPYGPVGIVDPGEWWATVAVHVMGSLTYMTHALPDMKAAGRGRVINVCSLDALTIRPNHSAYCVAKTAQLRLTEHVAAEATGTGVAVFAVHPGVAISPIAAEMIASPEARKWLPEDFMALCDQVQTGVGSDDSHAACGERCLALLSGRYDHLSGTLVNFHEFGGD